MLPYVHPPPHPYEAARAAVLALQSIFDGSEDVKVTPSPVRKATQESKQEKPNTDWAYWTGISGLNLQRQTKRDQPLVIDT